MYGNIQIVTKRFRIQFLKRCDSKMPFLHRLVFKGPCKRTQQVTTLLRVVGGFWPTMLRPFAWAKKFDWFQTIRNKYQRVHCCGSMQTDATCFHMIVHDRRIAENTATWSHLAQRKYTFIIAIAAVYLKCTYSVNSDFGQSVST